MSRELGQRIGCRWCDFVSRIEGGPVTEEWLHDAVCPNCGESGELHAYPIPGTWPSETVPACDTSDEQEVARTLASIEQKLNDRWGMTLDDFIDDDDEVPHGNP